MADATKGRVGRCVIYGLEAGLMCGCRHSKLSGVNGERKPARRRNFEITTKERCRVRTAGAMCVPFSRSVHGHIQRVENVPPAGRCQTERAHV